MPHTKGWATAATAWVSIALPGLCLAATLNVPGDYPTIQACIDAAVSGVDECVVAPGTYHETINFLGKAITLRSASGRDVTTIDATGIGGSVVTCATGEGPDTVLNGFTITGGTGTDLGGVTGGGGMYNDSSSPMVTNCTFSGNTAEIGGGMYNDNSNPTVSNCGFIWNSASHGVGGGMSNSASSPTVTDCTFSDNTALAGGGMDNNYYSNPVVINCTFIDNTSTAHVQGIGGGGMANRYYSNSMVSGCTFSSNKATHGGGMYNDISSPTVTHCAFTDNTGSGDRSFGGGGMYNWGGAPTVTHCTFTGNTSTGPESFGGGGMYNSSTSLTVTHCTFSGNNAYSGGGMLNELGSPTVTNCTFSSNTAFFGGGGMDNFNSNPTVTKCTFSDNDAYNYGGEMYNSGGSPTVTNCILWGSAPYEIVGGSPTVISFSDIHGGLPFGAVDGGGNIYVNPMFVRPPDPGPDGTWDGVDDDYGDLRLRGGSPCINAGDPGFAAQPGETDLEGHARVLCGRVDMGAYEFGIGDYNCDQTVDLTDFAGWNACMTGPLDSGAVHSTIDIRQSTFGCDAFDFDADGDVDLFDFAAFQRIIEP